MLFRYAIKRKIILALILLLLTVAGAGAAVGQFGRGITVDNTQRNNLHNRIDGMQNKLLETLMTGSAYDSISRGKGSESVPTAYPFPVPSNALNDFERTRKTAKLAWAEQLSKELGFPVVVHRQADKIIWVEIGDPNAPEMVMALSHLDSPTSSVSVANLARWRNSGGNLDPDAYKKPYIKDGWLYGAGVQDDSGPTLATLYAAKALMDAGFPMDRRVRIIMGIYEDGSPGNPTSGDVANFMSIPFYTAQAGFYDNAVYKYIHREEMPIAAFTSDSRFPVIIGNSVQRDRTMSKDLSGDGGAKFELLSGTMGVTDREGDPTLIDIVTGSGTILPSKAIFTLSTSGAAPVDIDGVKQRINNAAQAMGWTSTQVKIVVGTSLDLIINTGVAMEAPTPQYGKNAVVWGMHLLSKGLEGENLEIQKAAKDVADLFMKDGVEDYIGTYMGLGVRNGDNGSPLMTISYGSGMTAAMKPFFDPATKVLSAGLYIRSMYDDANSYNDAQTKITTAWVGKGWSTIPAAAFASPTLYLTHDNPLTKLQFASYKNSLAAAGFEDLQKLLPVSYPQGTTGGTLAGSFFNKMNAFGAVLPGNERWWHTANERIAVKSAVQMTKTFADCLLEMARYSGPAGAQFMSADIAGLDPSRADLDLLDVTIETYKDARSALNGIRFENKLVAATFFDIPMFRIRGNSSLNQIQIDAGHSASGIYLPVSSLGAKPFVLPMRLEFKIDRKELNINESTWNRIVNSDIALILSKFKFNVLHDGVVTPLNLPNGQDAGKYFFKRSSANAPDTLYISANLAIADSDDVSITTIAPVNSKTDLFELNPTWVSANPGYETTYPELANRGQMTQRGFFVISDGIKDARFKSPQAIFVTANVTNDGGSISGATTPSSVWVTLGSTRYSAEIQSDGTYLIILPPGTDLRAITLGATLPNGAKILPDLSGTFDFSSENTKKFIMTAQNRTIQKEISIKVTTETDSSSSSGGCNGGLEATGLMLIAGMAMFLGKKKR